MSEVVAPISLMPFTSLTKFFKTPKGLLVIALALLIPLAATASGFTVVAPGVAAAAITAMLIDAPILRYRDKAWSFPSGALLTGLLVAMVLSPFGSWKIAAMTAAMGVLSKYVVRGRSSNVFNPAALALVVSYFAFDTGQSWWGALPELPLMALAALFATGVFITDRVNKMPAVLAFLGMHFLLFTLTAFVGDPAGVAELYREPDLHAALFFAFFMVTDPPTSPPKARDQIVFGVITAVVSYSVFQLVGAVYFLLAGLLVANVWEAWRRYRVRAARTATAR
ncbi:RnfABCDGE type electron transport complex subunit D [Gemmatimonas sp.]|uniref:RnfABCDGE type electron transport complex subunit D n=2 Tax=Gemmatimonas sp. TaxID=1962908 RepID=UPI00356B4042